jgi:predicted TIM-barrel fold metal-dependent hydrolase
VAFDKPLLMHAGREPKSPQYACDPYLLCGAEKVEQVLSDYPELKLCVPHMGADEYEDFQRLMTDYDNLWLDTTMTLSDYLFLDFKSDLGALRKDRIIFGTDFPNLPYAWDRELKRLCKMNLSQRSLGLILGRNAKTLFSIQSQD